MAADRESREALYRLGAATPRRTRASRGEDGPGVLTAKSMG